MVIQRIKLLILFVLLTIAAQSKAAIYQKLDRNDIHAGETFVLDIWVDEDVDDAPDLSLIPADFTIVGNTQYQNTQIFNGQVSSIKGWKLVLKTLKTGPVTIPPITVGHLKTKPISLIIKKSSDRLSMAGNDKAIFMTAEVDNESVYVQQQILYKLKLYRSVPTHYTSLSAPYAEDTIVEKLGDDVQFETEIKGVRYLVLERTYALFPQKSGKITISGVTFTADVAERNRRGFSNYLNNTRPVSVSTSPIDIEVKPRPQNASEPWLPASKVTLAERWQPEATELKVGQPVTWTLLLSVAGQSEDQLPAIEIPEVEGIQFYPDAPPKDRQLDDSGIVGQRIQKYALIPSRAGKVTLPAIKLRWWNVREDREEVAEIKAREFNILPAAPAVTDAQKPAIPGEVISPPRAEPSSLRFWQASSALLALTCLILAWQIWQLRKILNGANRHKPEIHRPASATQHKKAFLEAITNKQWKLAESELLRWLSANLQHNFTSVGQILRQLDNSELKQKLTALETACYASGDSESIPSVHITGADMEAIVKAMNKKKTSQDSQSLPPFYAT